MRRRERILGPAALIAFAVVLTGCSGSNQAASTAPGPSTVTASTTPPVAPPASPIALATGTVAPGMYTVSGFPVAMSFEVEEGWHTSHLTDLSFDLVRPEGVLIFSFLPDGPSPESFLQSLVDKGLEPATPEPGTLDEAPSQRTDVHADEAVFVIESPPEVTYGLRAGTDLSLDLVPLEGGLLVVAIEARSGALPAARAAADPVLATVQLD